MLCPCCSTAMLIDHSSYKLEGDASPTETTRVFSVPYFVCPSPHCGRYMQVVEGEATLLFQQQQGAQRQMQAVKSLAECCGQALCVYDEVSFSMPEPVLTRALLRSDFSMDFSCPTCNRAYRMPPTQRERERV